MLMYPTMDKEIMGSVTLDVETSNRNASFSRRMQKYYEALKGGKTIKEVVYEKYPEGTD